MDETKTKAKEPEAEEPGELDAGRMPFMAHVAELRKRLVISAIAVGAGFGVAWGFREPIVRFIAAPLVKVLPPGQKLIYTGVAEAFVVYMKMSFLVGLLMASPVIFYQLWQFISPGLYKHERKWAIYFTIPSSLLFIGGAVFGYKMVFPLGFKYFIGFGSDLIQPLPALHQYFSFSTRFLIVFGAIFELPIVITLLARMGLVTDKFLSKNRKWSILLIFIVAAIFTPPDALSQIMMAVPLYALYEVSIILAKIFGRQREAAAKAADEDRQKA